MRTGDVIGGRFEVEVLAGAGGMGQVYRALDRQSGARVAVKVIGSVGDPGRFGREARLLAELEHPAVVRYIVHDASEIGAFIAMEWLEGEDLAARLARAPLSVFETMVLGRRIAEALGAAHARGVVHRDVKPSNVLLEGGDPARAKLLDFGIARRDDTFAKPSFETIGNGMLGTLGYMAPEQARSAANVDARADVFSLGCVLFECLTGGPAFAGAHPVAILSKLLLEDAPRLRGRAGMPDGLSRIVDRMLAKEPKARPQDGAAVAQELAAISTPDLTMVPATLAAPGPPSLTGDELCLVSVVLARGVTAPRSIALDATANSADADTLAQATLASTAIAVLTPLELALGSTRASLERLADGSLAVAIHGGATSPSDQAAAAAHVALALKLEHPQAIIALSTGRGRASASLPIGEAIDRAAALLAEAQTTKDGGRAVSLDAVTAGLLDARFEVRSEAHGLFLYGAGDAIDSVRTLLGKPTSCVGRERELTTLLAVFDECVEESVGRVVRVVGEAGLGKSRLAHELARRLRSRGEPTEIWSARADAMGAGSSLGMLSRALRGAAHLQDGEPLGARRDKLRARVARSVEPSRLDFTTEFLGELVNVAFPDEASPSLRAARADARLMGDSMRRAWEDFVLAEARSSPLVLFLEDLHFGDASTISFIESALRNAPDVPWMVVAFARPEGDADQERADSVTASSSLDALHPIEIALGPLGKKAAEKLVREALGRGFDEGVIARIVARAGGNGFLLEELVRAEAEGQTDAPETVLAMAQARLERLPDNERRVLRGASVFGETFWAGGAVALLGGERAEVLVHAALTKLAEREIIDRHPSSRLAGQLEYGFRNALVRDAAYRMLVDEDRTLGHDLAAQWLARAGLTDVLAIAQHEESGRAFDRAQRSYLVAAREALEGNDLPAAVALADRGIACGANGQILGGLRMIQATAHSFRGENAEARRRSGEVLANVATGSRQWFEAIDVHLYAGQRLGLRAEDAPLVEELLATPGLEGTESEHAIALAAAAWTRSAFGERAVADACIAAAEPLAIDDAGRARVVACRAHRWLSSGDVAAFVRDLTHSVALCERTGNQRRKSISLAAVGYGQNLLGDAKGAEKTLVEALALAERLGSQAVVAAARQNLGLAIAAQGRLDEARAIEEASVQAFAEGGDARMEGGSRIYLALILLESGDLERAAAEARRAVELVAGFAPMSPYARAVLARTELARGDLGRAHGAILEATRTLDVVEDGEATIRLVQAEIARACGREREASELIAVARERLLERASKISDPSWRQSFLHGVRDHARTLELAIALLGS